jgi:nitroimidazol reductase NimA-like FMN-containing flavoprotein (pyridoxamine 5'-phosphate oxidase superfamily)
MRKKVLFEDKKKIEEIIGKSEVCYIGMTDEDNMPYVLPFNFGYKDNCIFLHSASSGKKLNILEKNNNVCVVFSTGHELRFQHPDVACSYMMKYKSVQAFGRVEFVDDYTEKIEALNMIMHKYTGRDFKFGKPSVDEVRVFKVIIDKITGKEFGY